MQNCLNGWNAFVKWSTSLIGKIAYYRNPKIRCFELVKSGLNTNFVILK
jgi:hypothetical protein